MTDFVELVRRAVAAWNRDDFEGCVEFAHPEIEWRSQVVERLTGQVTVYRGLEGVRRYWDEFHGLMRVKLRILEIVQAGDTVVMVSCTEARGDSSGVIVRQPIGYVYEFEDGMARKVRSFTDPDEAYEAAGIERGSASKPELYSAVLPGR
jgi:ketosteroid isomerase-like protein